MEKTEAQLKEVYDQIEKSNLMFNFLEWTKSFDKSNGKLKATTSNVKKTAMDVDGKVFKSKLQSDLNTFREHTMKMIAQCRRVKQAREMAEDATQHSKAIRIDWSENMELYQTKQEK